MAPGRKPLRALLDDPDFQESCVYCCNADVVQRRAGGGVNDPAYLHEAAGYAFARLHDTKKSDDQGTGGKTGSRRREVDSDSEAGEEYGSKSPKAKAQGFLKLSDCIKDVDLYELIGCSEGASQDEIRKAYRALALTAHPDKQTGKSEEEMKKIQEKFVQIQEGYEVLSDPAKRMQYDSSLDFDDDLPRFKPDGDEDFYEVFGEAFRRNARFSIKRPVPDFGDAETKADDWKKFYNFWHEFQTWRDPVVMAEKAGEDICDLNDADCREEKRWMMRENDRVAKKYRRAEVERICDLVRMAEKYDPRIQAEKDAKKAARQAEAAKRAEAQNAVQRAKEEAERKRLEEEEKARAIAEAKRKEEKTARDAAKAVVKQCRQRLRTLHQHVSKFVVIDQLNEVCLRFEEAELRKLADDFEAALKKKKTKGCIESAAAVFHKAIESIGLKPILAVDEEADNASTSSGPESIETEDPEVVRQRELEAKKRAAAAKKTREAEEKKAAAEKVIRDAEKAEEKKKRDEQRRKEQAAAEALKRQQEKKESEKVKKAEEKKKKDEEQARLKKEQQREEGKKKAQEQAEADKAAAEARNQEAEVERLVQLFTTDRLDRLTKLDAMTDEDLSQSLQDAADGDASLKGALRILKRVSAEVGADAVAERATGVVYTAGFVWPLALLLDPEVRLPNAVRNRAKKARQRLQDQAKAFLAKPRAADADEAAATEMQKGLIDGSIEVPVWNVTLKEEEDEALAPTKAAQSAVEEPAEAAAKGKKKKAAKAKAGDEDIDALLAELDTVGSKKTGKKKKN